MKLKGLIDSLNLFERERLLEIATYNPNFLRRRTNFNGFPRSDMEVGDEV